MTARAALCKDRPGKGARKGSVNPPPPRKGSSKGGGAVTAEALQKHHEDPGALDWGKIASKVRREGPAPAP